MEQLFNEINELFDRLVEKGEELIENSKKIERAKEAMADDRQQ